MRQQSQHCSLTIALLAKEQGETAAKFPEFIRKRNLPWLLNPLLSCWSGALPLHYCSPIPGWQTVHMAFLLPPSSSQHLSHLSISFTKMKGKDFSTKLAAGFINFYLFSSVGLGKVWMLRNLPCSVVPTHSQHNSINKLQVDYEKCGNCLSEPQPLSHLKGMSCS